MRVRPTSLLALLLALALPAMALAAEAVPGADRMVAHRAAYRLSLAEARSGGTANGNGTANSNIAAAQGAMLYEVGDACEGWTTRQRFQLVVTDRDGQTVETASDYSTYETKDGRTIRFTLTQLSQGAVTQRIAGEATITPEGGTVTYTEPEQRTERLPPGTLLPTIHTIATLDAARAGRRLVQVPLLDGTSAEGAQDTTTVITGWLAAQPVPRFPALSMLGSARMRVAFFERNSAQGGAAGAPAYEVSLRYWENGVADELKMDFGEFVIDGRLQELSILPGGC